MHNNKVKYNILKAVHKCEAKCRQKYEACIRTVVAR